MGWGAMVSVKGRRGKSGTGQEKALEERLLVRGVLHWAEEARPRTPAMLSH